MLFSLLVTIIYIPKMHKGPFLHILTSTSFSLSFGDDHSNRCEVLSHIVVLICISLIISDVEPLSKYLLECCLVAQSCLIFCSPMDYSPPGWSATDFSRQEYWSGVPFPSPGHLPNQRLESTSIVSPALAGRFFITTTTSIPSIRTSNYNGLT